MSGFTITITDAGRAALINAQNNGTTAFVLSEVGVSTQAVTGSLKGLTALPNETKRLATMAGDVVANDTLHVTIRDEGTSAYALRAFGLYTSTGVLFAAYSQAEPIIEKSSAAMLLLAVDAKLLALDTAQVEFGPVGFTLPPASETVAGITEVATDHEADAGTDNWRYITPRLLKRALGALSGFAAIGHKHDAADIETGTFHASRIPSLAMSKIMDLVGALDAKAASVHGHTVSHIEGLSTTLAGKANTQHGHHADDISQGVFSVGRIPALAMEKITGLAGALSNKATLGSNVTFQDICAFRPNGTGVVYVGDTNHYLFFDGANYNLPHGGLIVNNGHVWTSATFDPGSKANRLNPEIEGALTVSGAGAMVQFRHRDDQGRLAGLYATAGVLRLWDTSLGDVARFTAGNLTLPTLGGPDRLVWHTANLSFAGGGTITDPLYGPNTHDQMLSPAGLWSFPRAIGVSGYQQIPGTDLILQWGSSNAAFNEGPVHTTLPVAFGGGCLVAMAVPRNAAQSIPRDYYMQVAGRYQDRIVFYANHANAQSGTMIGFEWLAIGRAAGTPDPVYTPPGGGGGGDGGGGDGGEDDWPPVGGGGEAPYIP